MNPKYELIEINGDASNLPEDGEYQVTILMKSTGKKVMRSAFAYRNNDTAKSFWLQMIHSYYRPLKEEPTPTGIIRSFDSNKYYWCKCEGCGWEDSSEFCEGCHPIGDTGDHSDPVCPVCFGNNLDGEAVLSVPDSYSGVIDIYIPFDLIIEPYKKAIKGLSESLDNLIYRDYALQKSTPTPEREGVQLQDFKKAIAAAFDDGKKYGFGSKYNFKGGVDYFDRLIKPRYFTTEESTLPTPTAPLERVTGEQWVRCSEHLPGYVEHWYQINTSDFEIRRIDNKSIIAEYFSLYCRQWGLENFEWRGKTKV